ncbi:30S ribosomal protein S4 chloroplastic [Bienertia sinuspersici]
MIKESLCRVTEGLVSKKIRRLGALPGLTSKRPRAGSDLRNQSVLGKDLNINDNYLNTFVSPEKAKGSTSISYHRHILVNGRIVDIPSYRCKPQDTIMSRDEQKSKALIQNSLDSSLREELPNI